jgi:hypothetical protein
MNAWDDTSIATIKRWIDNIEKASFVYNDVLKNSEKNTTIVSYITLLITSSIALLSTLAVAFGTINVQWVVFAFNITILIISYVNSITAGVSKINGWHHTEKQYTKHIERLNALWFVLQSELDIPVAERINASDFIKRMYGQHTLLMQGPDIDDTKYMNATNKFKNVQKTRYPQSVHQLEEIVV